MYHSLLTVFNSYINKAINLLKHIHNTMNLCFNFNEVQDHLTADN